MSIKNELSRITIDIPKEHHKRLKALAALEGKSMREIIVEYIEERILVASSDEAFDRSAKKILKKYSPALKKLADS